MSDQISNESRRDFLKTGAVSAGGLVIGFFIPETMRSAMAASIATQANLDFSSNILPNAFVKIAPDGTITLIINKLEMGQGVNTSLAQLIAEELECDWTKIRSESAPVDVVYNHTAMPFQLTGGSSALAKSWEQHRRIGAMAREMLISAAAKKWGVPKNECSAQNSEIHHSIKGKISYGELANFGGNRSASSRFKTKRHKRF